MSVRAPQPGERAPDTVVEALTVLESRGYTESFHIKDGELRCGAGDECGLNEIAVVECFFRFEGASNPDDESIVFGLLNPRTSVRGTLVSGFGPSADPEEMDVLVLLYGRASSD